MAISLSSITPKLFGIARSTAAGGLAGGAAFALIVVAQAYGVTVTPDTAMAVVGGVTWLVTHFVPDSMTDHVKAVANKMNVSSKDVAQQLLALIPETDASYPGNDGKAATNLSNIVTGNKVP